MKWRMMNWKGFGRKWSWPNFEVLFGHSPVVTEKNHKILSRDIWSLGRDLSLVPAEYEARLLTILP
jgi:hypothetical protein